MILEYYFLSPGTFLSLPQWSFIFNVMSAQAPDPLGTARRK